MRHRTGKYTVCKRVRAPFSPDILQAGSVKRLSSISFLNGVNVLYITVQAKACCCGRLEIETRRRGLEILVRAEINTSISSPIFQPVFMR